MREILTIPNDILRQKCRPVEEIDATVKALAEELVALMGVKHEGLILVSIAAPQVGEPLRMFAYRVNPHSSVPDTRVIINPVLSLKKEPVMMNETCLSIPGKEYLVSRHKIVKLRGTNIYGRYCSYKETGIVAQVFQHELNHLDGILIDDIGVLV